jgi:RNA methyltransferase, TrmH family
MAASEWPIITSATNEKLKLIKKLYARRQREKAGLILLEGHRLVLDALEAGLSPQFVLCTDAALSDAGEGERLRAALLATSDCNVLRAPTDLFNGVSDTTTPQGVLGVFPTPELPLPPKPSLVLVCDAVSDPGNLGTLLRSAAGAGVCAALLTPGCSDAWGPKALRAGMGAQCRLPTRQLAWPQIAAELEAWGCVAFAADAAGEVAHFEVDWRAPSALVVGSEAHGLSDVVRHDPSVSLCSIPMGIGAGEGVESLNAAVAGSVILFEAARQRLQSS